MRVAISLINRRSRSKNDYRDRTEILEVGMRDDPTKYKSMNDKKVAKIHCAKKGFEYEPSNFGTKVRTSQKQYHRLYLFNAGSLIMLKI